MERGKMIIGRPGARLYLGVIGDTHGVVPPGAARLFSGVDHIIHTGDAGSAAVLEALMQIAPVTAVRGNYDTDPGLLSCLLPDPSALIIAGLPAVLTHRLITLEWSTYRHLIAAHLVQSGFAPRLFFFGHIHSAVLEELQGIWFINPGYAGPDPLEGPATAILVELDDGRLTGEIVRL